MRRFIFASAVLLALPAHAAQWEKSVDATGFSGTRPLLCSLGTKLYATQMHGTTDPAPFSVWDAASNTITSVTGRDITFFNEVLGIGCGTSTNRIYEAGRGRWLAYATTPFTSWTSVADLNVAAQGYGGILSDFGLGVALATTVDTGTDTFGVFTWDLASTSAGPSINAASGFANHELTGCKVIDTTGTNNDIYVGAAIDATLGAAGKVMAVGIDGDGDSRWTPNCGTGVGCENGASAHLMRQCASNGSTLAVTLAYNTSTNTTYATGWASDGTHSSISQTISSTDLRCVLYFDLDGAGAAFWAFTSAGVAYKSTGGDFSNASGTTYDLTLDASDTVTGCAVVNTTIPAVTTDDGDVFAWRTPINTRYIGGGSITGTGPIH